YRQNRTWYRAESEGAAFANAKSTTILRVDDNHAAADVVSVSSDGNRVIFTVPNADGEKQSPWRYDVRAHSLVEVIHNTRYDAIFLDEEDRPTFALDEHGNHGLQLFERTDRGWLERTIDLPPHTRRVIDHRKGTLGLEIEGTPKTRHVVWNPTTS